MNKRRPYSPLRGRRAELGLSQQAIAAALKCSASRVSLIEHGHYEATDEEKAIVAKLLKCRVDDIFRTEGCGLK